MGLATHLGPWLLGTVRSTTGTTAGTIRNLGATIVAQAKTVAYNDTAASQACVLPAGALITSIQLIQSTTFTSGTSGTFTVLLNASQIGQLTITTGTAGVLSITPDTAARAAVFANVGSADAIITYTGATLSAGAGTLVVAYMVRQADGTYLPTASTGP